MSNFGLRKKPPRNSDSLTSDFHSRCKKKMSKTSLKSNHCANLRSVKHRHCFCVLHRGRRCRCSRYAGPRLRPRRPFSIQEFYSGPPSRPRPRQSPLEGTRPRALLLPWEIPGGQKNESARNWGWLPRPNCRAPFHIWENQQSPPRPGGEVD